MTEKVFNPQGWTKLSPAQAAMLAALQNDGEVNSNNQLGVPRHGANKRTARALVELDLASWSRPENGQRWRIVERKRKLVRKGKKDDEQPPKVHVEIVAHVREAGS